MKKLLIITILFFGCCNCEPYKQTTEYEYDDWSISFPGFFPLFTFDYKHNGRTEKKEPIEENYSIEDFLRKTRNYHRDEMERKFSDIKLEIEK